MNQDRKALKRKIPEYEESQGSSNSEDEFDDEDEESDEESDEDEDGDEEDDSDSDGSNLSMNDIDDNVKLPIYGDHNDPIFTYLFENRLN